MSDTPRLDSIIATGNRGHSGFIDNNWITCTDGYRLSVIAGGGTLCLPKPTLCMCAWVPPDDQAFHYRPGEVAHDYPGPYTHVEVMVPDADDVLGRVRVEDVRKLIAEHGGEASVQS